jgi:hypothetical protein
VNWETIASGVLSALKHASRSRAITNLVRQGAEYVVVDTPAQELVFDIRALVLGFLSAGIEGGGAPLSSNTTTWLAEWLSERIGLERIQRALRARTPSDAAFEAFAGGAGVVLSRSVAALETSARALAIITVKREHYDGRHLLAAMIDQGALQKTFLSEFDLALNAEDVAMLKRRLATRITTVLEAGETETVWLRELGIGGAGAPDGVVDSSNAQKSEASQAPIEDAVSPFNGDTPIADDNDVLDTERDVEALAQLVCLDRVTPLAVAIFGDWGSGKSTFMARLEQAVRDMPGRDAGQALPMVEEASAARFVHPIVQIRFNAWHFADANLWASLTAEFFDQLRAGGYDRSGQARHAQLVQRVNQHVHALSDTLSANRKAMAKNGEAVLEAQKARDQAAKGVRGASGKVFARTSMNLLAESYAAQKGRLAALGLGGAADEGRAAGVIVGAAKDVSSAFGSTRAVWGVLKASRRLRWLALPPVAVLLGWMAVAWLKPDLKWLDMAAPALAGGIALAASIAKALGPALSIVRDVAGRGAALAGEIDAGNKAAVAALLTKEVELNQTLAEASALEDAELASAKALARYIDPAGKANPPRLLRYVLEDDPDTKALEKDIGLIGRTRRLFQAVDTIAREVRDARREQGYAERKDADWETPERIIIYIDDLDRCHEDKVYEVLQAIHLLLAFDLFVVVVGVDVKWVQAALAKQFETGDAQADAASEQQRNERAMHYLEKIFQIPFWLRPLSSGDEGTFRPFIEMLAGDSVETAREKQAAAEQARRVAEQSQVFDTPPVDDTAGDAAKPDKGATGGAGDRSGDPSGRREVKLAEARRKLQLTDAEIAFLGSPQIAALAATAPRGVKRLVNIYRIARARRGQEDGEAVLGGKGRLPEYPLIALMAAVETGQTFQVADWFYDLLDGGQNAHVVDLLMACWDQELTPQGLRQAVVRPVIEILIEACEAMVKIRKPALTADDLLAAARLVRRYSFNRYR